MQEQRYPRGFVSRPPPVDNGFNARIAPLTEEERISIDRARNVLKASEDYFAASHHFDLEQQNRGVL